MMCILPVPAQDLETRTDRSPPVGTSLIPDAMRM